MSKIAFSVWPDIPSIPNSGNIPDGIQNVHKVSEDTLIKSGFEVKVFNEETVDKYHTNPILNKMLEYATDNKRWYSKISDILRLIYMRELLDSYDEVMYLDMDLLLLQVPDKFGLAIETHLQQDQSHNPIDKFWMKGVNAFIYLNKNHIDLMDEMLEANYNCIINSNYNPKYCYAQSYLWPIENTVGVTHNIWLFGSPTEPLFCTEKKIIESMYLAGLIYNFTPKIYGVNMMGSRDHSGLESHIHMIHEINELMTNQSLNKEEILSHFSEKVRIRPNYNSDRTYLKNWIKENQYLFKGEPYYEDVI